MPIMEERIGDSILFQLRPPSFVNRNTTERFDRIRSPVPAVMPTLPWKWMLSRVMRVCDLRIVHVFPESGELASIPLLPHTNNSPLGATHKSLTPPSSREVRSQVIPPSDVEWMTVLHCVIGLLNCISAIQPLHVSAKVIFCGLPDAVSVLLDQCLPPSSVLQRLE
jgi:hypothetical protein